MLFHTCHNLKVLGSSATPGDETEGSAGPLGRETSLGSRMHKNVKGMSVSWGPCKDWMKWNLCIKSSWHNSGSIAGAQ